MNYICMKNFFNYNKKYLHYSNIQRLCSNFSNDKMVYIETYGCQMNFNDSEIAMSILKSDGYTHTTNLKEASVILLMTCAIREGAEDKIWDRLKYYHGINKRSSKLKIGVLGCMAERLKSKLLENTIAPVNLVCGPDAYRDLPRLLKEIKAGRKGMNVALSLEETYADITPVRLSSKGIPSAFVSIMRGCDNMCTYCIVPFTRGKERSRRIDSILKEVQTLSDQGIKEIVLLGQNVNSYRDMSESNEVHGVISKEKTKLADGFSTVYKPKIGGRRFVDLLDAVSQVNKEIRIRFTSPHPKDFPDEVLHLIRATPNICKQLHLPAQSGSSTVLQNMGRGYTREAYLNLVDKVRVIIPNVALTSDFISGFCGETEEDHQLTLSLLKYVRYNFIFCYPYSMREKTKAFHRLIDDVSDEIKSCRHLELAAAFRQITLEINQSHIGSIQLVLIDGTSKRSSNEWVGRNEANTKVIFPKLSLPFNNDLITNSEIPQIGDYVAVKIIAATSQTLKGDPICRSSIATFNSEIINSGNNTISQNKIPHQCYS